MRKIIFTAAMLLALAACKDGTDSRLMDAAKNTDFIGNPSSVQFRNVADGAPGVVCGEVKYQTADGRWAEWAPFILQTRVLELRDRYSDSPVDELNEKLCNP